jgi:hypothetical protein
VKAKKPEAGQTAEQEQRPVTAGDQLLNQIKEQQAALERQEGDAVAAVVRIGKLLCELRPQAKKDWAKQLEKIPMHPRIASRYMAIVNGAIGQIGPSGSDLLSRLPYDLQRLEKRTKLTLEQLKRLAQELDLRQATRDQITHAVKSLLGEATAARPPRPVLDRILDRFVGLHKLVAGHLQDCSPEEQQQCRTFVAGCLEEFESKVLNGDPGDDAVEQA